MQIQQLRSGGDRNFAYLLHHEGEALAVDPGEDLSELKTALEASGARLRWLVGTHAHWDHIAGMDTLRKLAGGDRVLSKNAGGRAEFLLKGGRAALPLGGLELELLATPGHTPCSLCLLTPECGGDQHLVSGDTLFVGKIGGTATEDAARVEYHSLHEVLMHLPDNVQVWPGHDYGTASRSTIGRERQANPFLLRPDFESFYELKLNWAEYKREHGIA